MRNIHIFPTEQYSKIVHSTSKYGGYFLSEHYSPMKEMGDSYQNIYIVDNDKKPKEGDYGIGYAVGTKRIAPKHYLFKHDGTNVGKINALCDGAAKVILTTDQELIKNRVQEIDNDFLRWFFDNQSCEYVDVGVEYINLPDRSKHGYYYKTIIPKEETGQEESTH